MNPNSYEDDLHSTFHHRYSLTIPYVGREEGGHAIVIMKNPSNAGKYDEQGRRVSDDTIYMVLDYIYKLQNYSIKYVTILNLFTLTGGTLKDLKGFIGTTTENMKRRENNIVIQRTLEHFDSSKDLIIAGWGAKSTLNIRPYKQRVQEVIRLLDGKPLYRVGPLVGKGVFPGHGKYWYDYKKLRSYYS